MNSIQTCTRLFGAHRLRPVASCTLALVAITGGVALSGGEAKAFAAWSQDISGSYTYRTLDNGASLPNAPGQFDPGWSPWLGDKRMKVLNGGVLIGTTTSGNDVEWSYKQSQARPWHMDLNQSGNINIASSYMYRVQINSQQDGLAICQTFNTCHPFFHEVEFGIQANNPAVPTKSIYVANGDTPGPLLLTLNNGQVKPFPSGFSDIIVQIDWPANQAVGDMYDNYSQAPAPLPLLSAGAALGSLRKLRQLSNRLKSVRMG